LWNWKLGDGEEEGEVVVLDSGRGRGIKSLEKHVPWKLFDSMKTIKPIIIL
jgi:hypothetical protein